MISLCLSFLQALKWTRRGTVVGLSMHRWRRHRETSTGDGPTGDVSVGKAVQMGLWLSVCGVSGGAGSVPLASIIKQLGLSNITSYISHVLLLNSVTLYCLCHQSRRSKGSWRNVVRGRRPLLMSLAAKTLTTTCP